MSTIRRIGLADFERLLAEWQPRRKINEFHFHGTWKPRHADFRGQATIEAMRAFHMGKGWSDIAQHLTIDPAGGLWTGREWDKAPASASGRNGNSQQGPFMIEVIGNFDKGNDVWDGPQKAATLGVIVAVLRKFDLAENAVRFHREFTNQKTCPGTSIKLEDVRAEVKALLANTAALVLPRTSDAGLDGVAVRGWFDRGGSGARGVSTDAETVDPPFAEVPEDEWMLAEQEWLAARIDRGPGAPGASRAPLPANEPLRRHAINLSKGLPSTKGDLDSVLVTPREIAEKHLVDYIEGCLNPPEKKDRKTPHLVFYAHGGLVSEKSASCYARAMLPWWIAHGVFPIFFIWESGLIETIRQRPRGARGSRGLTGLTDWLLEGVTQIASRRVWAEMKDDAANASRSALPQYEGRAGGAWQLAEALLPVLARYEGQVQLHAVGHSTGPILLSKFLPLLTKHGHPIRTLSYLAPAIRTDRFLAEVAPKLGAEGEIRDLCVYTMTDAAERDDTCAGLYRKSLLYFVREACEDRDDGRILGLQKDLYGDRELQKLFGLRKEDMGRLSAKNGVAAIEFSPPDGDGEANPLTGALQHGGFDNDAKTLFAVLERILGGPVTVSTTGQQFPSTAKFETCGMADATRVAAIPPADDDAFGCPCCRAHAGGRFDADGRDGFGDDGDSGDDAEPPPASPSSPPASSPTTSPAPRPPPRGEGGGRRVAVCVGIDAYRDMPLAGCVSDSRRWADALARQRFDVRTLVDAEATRQAMHDALSRLVTEASPGDELVFQYSGHGAQVKDVSGDEEDAIDEAFVPYDYADGQLLIDDDLHAITRGLPAGATLTLFMDCCHSGTNSRARRPRAAARDGARPRLLVLDRETVARYVAARGGGDGVSAGSGAGGGKAVRRRAAAGPGPGVAHFAACDDTEYAWESGGEGDFTRAALAVFDAAMREGWSNRQFIAAAIRGLGDPPRQHPRLWRPAPGLAARTLLAAP